MRSILLILLFDLPLCSSDLNFLISIGRNGAIREKRDYSMEVAFDRVSNFGDLTDIGTRSMYELGKAFRKEYSSFVPASFGEKVHQIFSAPLNSLISSSYAFLFGLYGPGTGGFPETEDPIHSMPPVSEIKTKIYHKSTLPKQLGLAAVHSSDSDTDYFFGKGCPSLQSRLINARNTLLMRYNSTFEPLYTLLEDNGMDPEFLYKQNHFSAVTAFDSCEYIISRAHSYGDIVEYKSALIVQCEKLVALASIGPFEDVSLRKAYLHSVAKMLNDKVGKAGAIPLKFISLFGEAEFLGAFLALFTPTNSACIVNNYLKISSEKSIKEHVGISDECISYIPFSSILVLEVRGRSELCVKAKYNNWSIKLMGKECYPFSDFILEILPQENTENFSESCGSEFLKTAEVSLGLIVGLIASMILFLVLLVLLLKTKIELGSLKREYSRIKK